MTSSARAGSAAPGGKGKKLIAVYSQETSTAIPPEVLKDLLWILIEAELLDPAWDFGHMSLLDEFVPDLVDNPYGTLRLAGGRGYEFAIRSKIDPTEIYRLSDFGEYVLGGPPVTAENAIIPVMTTDYFQNAQMFFFTPMGDVLVNL